MLNSIYRWLENLWNLRKIFDKYLPQQNDGFKITKVNRYYDPEYSVEYFDIEINGDKPTEKDK